MASVAHIEPGSITAEVDARRVTLSVSRCLTECGPWLALMLFAAAHVVLVVWSLPDIVAKLRLGDRAGDRLAALVALQQAGSLDDQIAVLFRIGSPGDYLPFWPAFALSGPAGIVAQSLTLYASALVALYAVARRVLSPFGATIATVAWVLLPSTLFHPHALVTEAVCVPAVVWLMVALVTLAEAKQVRPGVLMAAALLTAVLVFTRHVFLLLPFAIVLWMLIFRPVGVFGAAGFRSARPPLRFLIVSLSLAGLWWAALVAAPLRYPVGESVGGLKSNLFLRAERMAYLGKVDLPESYRRRDADPAKPLRLMEPAEFAAFAVHRPDLYVRTVAADAVTLFANPGMAMLAGRYLGLFDLQERTWRDLNKWRETREKEGFSGLARLMWATSPTGFVINAVGVAIWSVVLLVAAWGAVRLMADATIEPAIRLLLAGLVIYAGGLTIVMAGYTRWDHRAPIEIVIVIAFAAGAIDLRRRFHGADRLVAR